MVVPDECAEGCDPGGFGGKRTGMLFSGEEMEKAEG